jgi:PTS system mannose-specific IIA component
MIGLVVATHGTLGQALLDTVAMIIGPPDGACAVSLSREQAPGQLETRLRSAVRQVAAAEEGVLIMVDMFGGTPANVAMTLLEPGRVEVLTGVNLPMLLKFFNYRQNCSLDVLAQRLWDQSRDGIVLASVAMVGDP